MIELLDFEPPRRWAAASAVGDLLFLSGETGTDPATGEVVEGGVEAQADQAFANIAATLARLGSDLDHIVKLTVYLTDISELHAVGGVRARRLARPVPSSTVEVRALARPAMRVEIDAIAIRSRVPPEGPKPAG